MSPSLCTLGEAMWELPPLILHPFYESVPPASLLDSSKAALMLSGLMPSGGCDREDLRRRLVAGRYAEVRMLFYVGKDVVRWIGQCQEVIEHTPELQAQGIRAQSFAALLTADPPPSVNAKLVAWGVADYAALFTRAIGLQALFTEPPPVEILNPAFLTGYHGYADALFRCYMDSQRHRTIAPRNFHFELFASGEYSRRLEAAWGTIE